MPYDPFKKASEEAGRVGENSGLSLAEVIRVPDDGGHQIVVQEVTRTEADTSTGQEPTTVAVANVGDVGLPTPGDMVVLARFKNRRSVVLGTVYQSGQVPTYVSGQRTIGHEQTDANITIGEDGSVTIQPAEDKGVSIGGGVNNPLSFPHTEWSTSLSDEEIWSVDLQSDEELTVYRMELATKGGAVRQGFTLDLVDESDGTVLASTSDVFQGAATSAVGATVSARLTNDTGGRKVAAISSKISVTRT